MVSNLLMLLSFLEQSRGGLLRIMIHYEIVRGVDDYSINHELLRPLLVHPDIPFWDRSWLRMKIHVTIKVHPRDLFITSSTLVS